MAVVPPEKLEAGEIDENAINFALGNVLDGFFFDK